LNAKAYSKDSSLCSRTLFSSKMKPKKFINTKTILGGLLASLSFQVFLGSVIGYFFGKFFSGEKTGDPCANPFRSWKFDIGKYKVHVHHWLICSLILATAVIWHYLPVFKFSFGFLGGVIFQGISCYEDWKKIVVKKNCKK